MRGTVAIVLVLASVSAAKTIQVFPGPGTLQAAIDAAVPDDRLALEPGGYDGAVVDVPGIRISGSNVEEAARKSIRQCTRRW